LLPGFEFGGFFFLKELLLDQIDLIAGHTVYFFVRE